MVERQRILADFGQFALRSDSLDAILTEACRLVGEALGTGRAKILELQEGGNVALVRAGVGWKPDVVGKVRLAMNERSSESYSLKKKEPVITRDIHQEDRFETPEFMKKAGVVALVNVPILVPGGNAYGLLQVDSTEPREFGEHDIAFLRTYATILGPVIDRLEKVRLLEARERRFRLIMEQVRDYAIYMSDPDDVITDWLPGAAAVFGWSAR
jgi:GAF domain-containing protein